jgi:SAM-dependent MidA family methyltransferase
MTATDHAASGILPLAERLRARIKREGPITFHDWMAAALYDPPHGYYCRSDLSRWGREGDYRTSPERSALFAGTFARYFAKLYQELGAPAQWTIFEVGGGNGEFAAVVLETLEHRYPSVFSATSYVIDEVSVDSRTRAKQRVTRFGKQVSFSSLREIETIDPGLIFANEVLDAFPVHRVTMRGGELSEFYVGISSKGAFEWIVAAASTTELARYFETTGTRLLEGQIAEVNLAAEDWFKRIATRLVDGYLITVDYGAEARELYGSPARRQGTLRAFYRHHLVDDVLAHPGEQDLTATIDWTFVKRLGSDLGLEPIEFEGQDRFLVKAGFLEEMELTAAETTTESEKLSLRTDAREMILPGGMAASFQVLVQRKRLDQFVC